MTKLTIEESCPQILKWMKLQEAWDIEKGAEILPAIYEYVG